MIGKIGRFSLFLVLLSLLLTVGPVRVRAEGPEPDGAEEEAEPDGAAEEETEPDWDLTPLPEEWFDDAVFIGDSITAALGRTCAFYGGLGKAVFATCNSYGVRSAFSYDFKLWYRGKGYFPWELLPVTGASKLFIMLGANDISQDGGIDATMDGWERLCSMIRGACPELQIFIMAHLPIWYEVDKPGLNNEALADYNRRLREFALENGFVFVDVREPFLDEHGGLSSLYTEDYYVHVNADGCRVWAEELKNPARYSGDPRNCE